MFKKSFWKKEYAPTQEFVEKTKAAYLAAFRKKFPAMHSVGRLYALRYYVRGFAAGIALMIVVSGAATYADQKNVGPESILYPLKRSKEIVDVTLVDPSEKPIVHLKLAQRRFEEIEKMKEKNPQNPRIENLSKDLDRALYNSFEAINGDQERDASEVDLEADFGSQDEFETEDEHGSEKEDKSDEEYKDEHEEAPQSGKTVGDSGLRPQETLRTREEKGEDVDEERSEEETLFEPEDVRKRNGENSDGDSKREKSKRTVDRSRQKRNEMWCQGLRELVESGATDIKKQIRNNPKFFERFSRTCQAQILTGEDAQTTIENMKISSPAFGHNQSIPPKYTCDGENVNPPFMISGASEGTKSFVLINDDPDAPMGTWVHWTLWNIGPKTTEIGENSVPAGTVEGITSFGNSGYGGPCPPSGTHRYFFKLYALDTTLDLDVKAKKIDVEKAMEGHILDRAELVGLYKRK